MNQKDLLAELSKLDQAAQTYPANLRRGVVILQAGFFGLILIVSTLGFIRHKFVERWQQETAAVARTQLLLEHIEDVEDAVAAASSAPASDERRAAAKASFSNLTVLLCEQQPEHARVPKLAAAFRAWVATSGADSHELLRTVAELKQQEFRSLKDRVAAEAATMKKTKIFTDVAPFPTIFLLIVSFVFVNRMEARRRKVEQVLWMARKRFEAFMNFSPAGGFLKHPDGKILYANRMLEKLWKMAPGAWLGKSVYEICPPGYAEEMDLRDREVLRTGQPKEAIDVVEMPSGEKRHLFSVRFPIRSGWDEVLLGGMSLDVTDQQRDQAALQESEARYRELFDTNPFASFVYEIESGLLCDVNAAGIAQYGYSREELMQAPVKMLYFEEEQPAGTRADLPQNPYTTRHIRKDGSLIWVEITATDVVSQNTRLRRLIVNDVTAREQAALALQQSETLYRGVVEHAGDIVYQTDMDGRFTFYNQAAVKVLGYDPAELRGRHYMELVIPEDRLMVGRFYKRQLKINQISSYLEFRCLAKNGTAKWLGQNVQLLMENGKLLGFQSIAREITDQKIREARLARDAAHDALTGLPNRRFFDEKLSAMVAEAHVREWPFCACIVDLDKFKVINDRFGHAAGDEVLRTFGKILAAGLRKCDVAARIAGDEFAVLFPQTTLAEATLCVDRIRQRFETLAFGVDSGVPFSAGATFGLAELRPGMTDLELFQCADTALYRGKSAGRNRVEANTVNELQ